MPVLAWLGLLGAAVPALELARRYIIRPAYRGAKALNDAAKDLNDFRADLSSLLDAVLSGAASDVSVERRLRRLESITGDLVAVNKAHSVTHDHLVATLAASGIAWRERPDG